jgi:hypothetical protein
VSCTSRHAILFPCCAHRCIVLLHWRILLAICTDLEWLFPTKVTLRSCNWVDKSSAHFYLLYGLNLQLHGHLIFQPFCRLLFPNTYRQKLSSILDTDCWCIFYCSHHRWTLRSTVSCGTGNRHFHPGVLNRRSLHLLEIQVCYEINILCTLGLQLS